ncbi:vacuolar protein sorting-associated protein VPS17 [Rhodotorula toruloides]|uniref:Vacuolar protein sorting-associated protein VPS17 n=1 Tax=Rhodotorula toruloides TaxID=5286 RepID=A0A511KF64_RHOTO|nr:vacuolar protein sorting-associated protein VPS17 [Rhodotorula toruloides]
MLCPSLLTSAAAAVVVVEDNAQSLSRSPHSSRTRAAPSYKAEKEAYCAPRCCTRSALALLPPNPSSSASFLSSSTPCGRLSPTRPALKRNTETADAFAMNDYDPLHPAAYDPSPRQSLPHPGSDLSSVAPRAPLPGYDRDYRAPGFGPASPPAREGDAWQQGGTSGGDGWGASGEGQQQQGRTAGLVPRSAQVADSMHGRRAAGEAGASGGQVRQQQREGFLRIRIMGLERNRRDIYIKFNAETNLANFHHSSYRSISRSYGEFMSLVSALSVTCPQSIVPALPLAQTSAASDEEDDRLIKAAFQKWVVRLTSDSAVVRDEEMRSFIESDFGYTARSRKKSAAASFSFSRSSRLPGELDDPLTLAKISMSRLESTFHDTAKTIDRVSKTRRAAATSVNDLGDQLNTFALAESYAPLANGFKRLARTMKVDADLLAVQSMQEQVTLGDMFVYQSANAKSAKETLSGRDAVADEHRQAVKASISKRRNIEKLKSASSLKADKVNEALEDLDEAQRYEETLARRLQGISTNLQPSLTRHSIDTHADLVSSLLEHARQTLVCEKQRLKEFELLRPDVRAIKRPEAGVIYHTTPGGQVVGRAGSVGSASASSRSTAPAPASPTPSRAAPPSSPAPSSSDPLARGTRDLGSMAQKAQKRTVRSMASSVHVEGDRRQKVDARMAASMLANGF